MLYQGQRARKRYLGMHGPWVRGMALGFVAFLLLASGRALVPGMCATQTALLQNQQDHAVESAYWQAATCCTVDWSGNAHEAPAAPSSSAPVCAFCNLAHAIIDEPVPVFIAVPAFEVNDTIPATDSVLLCWDLDPTVLGRAPPVIFA